MWVRSGSIFNSLNTFVIQCLIMACPHAVNLLCSTGLSFFLIVSAVSWERGMTLSRPPLLDSLFLPSPLPALPLCLMQLQYNNSVWGQYSRQDFGLNKHPRGHVIAQQPSVPVSKSVPQCWGQLHNTFLPCAPSQLLSQPNHHRKNTEHGTVIHSPDIEYHLLPSPQSNSWFPGSSLVCWEGMRWNQVGSDSAPSKAPLFTSAAPCCNVAISSRACLMWRGKHAL